MLMAFHSSSVGRTAVHIPSHKDNCTILVEGSECAEGKYWPSDEEHELKYSEEMKKKITNEYLSKIFATSKNITISGYDTSLSEETSKFLYAVIYKDDSNL